MKTITFGMSDVAARELAKIAFDKQIQKAKGELDEELVYIIRKYVPEPVLKIMDEYGDIVSEHDALYISIDDIKSACFHNLPVKMPRLKEIMVDKEDFEKVMSLNLNWQLLRDKQKKYKNEVSNILCLEVRSIENCEKVFPEALPYLLSPEALPYQRSSESDESSSNLDEIRSMLCQQGGDS